MKDKSFSQTSFFNFQIRVIKNRVYLKDSAREQRAQDRGLGSKISDNINYHY